MSNCDDIDAQKPLFDYKLELKTNKPDIKIVLEPDRQLVGMFIKRYHYSHTYHQGIYYAFTLYYCNRLKGLITFSNLTCKDAVTSIFNNERQDIGMDLNRFFTFDDTPENFESYCISKILKWLKHHTKYDVVISYADPNYDHFGYLYQSLNAYYIGKTDSSIAFLYKDRLIPQRTWSQWNKSYLDYIKSQKIEKKEMKPKHKYIWFICDKRRKYELLSKLKVNIVNAYPKGGNSLMG